MLFDASCVLASRCQVLSSVARTENSLSLLNKKIKKHGVTHHMLSVDWHDEFQFAQSIDKHIDAVGCPSLILAWLHNHRLMHKIVAILSKYRVHCQLTQVHGSAAASPEKSRRYWLVQTPEHVIYKQVILGFRVEEGRSRWLTNQEISTGVVSAIDGPEEINIVGQVEPWSLRP